MPMTMEKTVRDWVHEEVELLVDRGQDELAAIRAVVLQLQEKDALAVVDYATDAVLDERRARNAKRRMTILEQDVPTPLNMIGAGVGRRRIDTNALAAGGQELYALMFRGAERMMPLGDMTLADVGVARHVFLRQIGGLAKWGRFFARVETLMKNHPDETVRGVLTEEQIREIGARVSGRQIRQQALA